MKNEKRFWGVVALVFVAIIVWHVTSAIVPSLAAGIKALTPFLLAFITAYLLRHPVIWVESFFKLFTKRKSYKWQHVVSSFLVLIVFLGLAGLLIGFMIPGIINNISDVIENLPSFVNVCVNFVKETVNDLSQKLDKDTGDKIIEAATSFGGQLISFISNGATTVVTGLTGIITKTASFVFDFVLYIVASFMLLHGYDSIKLTLKRCLRLVTEPEKYDETCLFLHDCDVILEKYIVVRLVTSLGIGVISYFGFLLFGLPYSLLLALVIAVTNLIPYVGPFIGAVPVIIIALATGEMSTVIGVSIFMLVVQQIEGNVLTPLLTSDALEVSPILVLAGIAVFGAMLGVPGMILGAPIIAIISGLVKRSVEIAEKKAEKKEKKDEIK